MNATFESHVAVARKGSKGEIGNLARRNGNDKKHGRSVLIVCRMISQKPYTASRYAVGVHYCKTRDMQTLGVRQNRINNERPQWKTKFSNRDE